MSGHSKWATIHRQKEANDAKKGAVFTKLSLAITMAVKQGGGVDDPDKNFRLRLAVDRARQFNMPKDNIFRAIEKAKGVGGGTVLSELTLEGFLPGGSGLLVEVLTDNKLRTAQRVREVVDKGGGNMAGLGAVSYLFSQVGEIQIKNTDLQDDDELKLIDLGVGDIRREPEVWVVYCEKEKLIGLNDRLESAGYVVNSCEMIMKPGSKVAVNDEQTAKIEVIIDKLERLDEVIHLWTNYA